MCWSLSLLAFSSMYSQTPAQELASVAGAISIPIPIHVEVRVGVEGDKAVSLGAAWPVSIALGIS